MDSMKWDALTSFTEWLALATALVVPFPGRATDRACVGAYGLLYHGAGHG